MGTPQTLENPLGKRMLQSMLLPFCPRQIKPKIDMMHFYHQNNLQTDFNWHSLGTWTFATSSSQIHISSDFLLYVKTWANLNHVSSMLSEAMNPACTPLAFPCPSCCIHDIPFDESSLSPFPL